MSRVERVERDGQPVMTRRKKAIRSSVTRVEKREGDRWRGGRVSIGTNCGLVEITLPRLACPLGDTCIVV